MALQRWVPRALVVALAGSVTIAGVTLRPFLTEGNEGFDINQPHDWELTEALVAANSQALPEISKAPYVGAAAEETR